MLRVVIRYHFRVHQAIDSWLLRGDKVIGVAPALVPRSEVEADGDVVVGAELRGLGLPGNGQSDRLDDRGPGEPVMVLVEGEGLALVQREVDLDTVDRSVSHSACP